MLEAVGQGKIFHLLDMVHSKFLTYVYNPARSSVRPCVIERD